MSDPRFGNLGQAKAPGRTQVHNSSINAEVLGTLRKAVLAIVRQETR